MDEIKIIRQQTEEIKKIIFDVQKSKTWQEVINNMILIAFCTEAILIKCKEYEDKENAKQGKH